MKSYLKFLSRNKLYTAIEAVGLIVSLAFLILTGLSVRDQLHIRNTAPPGTNLYVVGSPSGLNIEYTSIDELRSFPEIRSASMFLLRKLTVETPAGKTALRFLIVDPTILDMVPQRVLSGSTDVFRDGSGVLITESAARRMFPGEDPLMQSITVSNLTVTGEEDSVREPIVAVIGDPDFSIFEDFDCMVGIRSSIPSVKEIAESDVLRVGYGTIHTIDILADMEPGFDMDAFSDRYRNLLGRFARGDESGTPMAIPYREVFFSTRDLSPLRQGKVLYLEVLIILVLVLLASAVLNYINLSLASSGGRAREMATRRLVGAERASIIYRSILESLTFTFICFLLAVILAKWLVPLLNSLRPDGLTVPFRVSLDGPFLIISFSLVLVVGVLSGLAPALFMASYRPIDIVSGEVRRKRKMAFNKVCIVFQTALSIVLTAIAITLEAQLRFMENTDLGISPVDNLFYFNSPTAGLIDGLSDIMASSPRVKAIGRSYGFPTRRVMITITRDNITNTLMCDSTAFRLTGYRVKEAFSDPVTGSVWITEETATATGITRENQDLTLLFPDGSRYASSFGGILENYRYQSVNGNLYSSGSRPFLNALVITGNQYGPMLQTDGNRKGFERWFKDTAREYYRKTKGLSDVFSDTNVECGYIEDIIASDFEDLHRYARLIQIFALLSILLAMLGMLAMSTWYASSNAKNIAVRKVFGSTVESEVRRNARSFMLMTLAAAAVAIPISVVVVRKLLETKAERITGTWWIYVVATILILVVAYASVLWQTLRAARTDPAVELKKE